MSPIVFIYPALFWLGALDILSLPVALGILLRKKKITASARPLVLVVSCLLFVSAAILKFIKPFQLEDYYPNSIWGGGGDGPDLENNPYIFIVFYAGLYLFLFVLFSTRIESLKNKKNLFFFLVVPIAVLLLIGIFIHCNCAGNLEYETWRNELEKLGGRG